MGLTGRRSGLNDVAGAMLVGGTPAGALMRTSAGRLYLLVTLAWDDGRPARCGFCAALELAHMPDRCCCKSVVACAGLPPI